MRYKIAVLDSYTLNPGDLSWEELTKLADCAFYDRTAEKEIIERSGEADIIITNKVPLSAEIIQKLKNLKCIIVSATGYNVVDIKEAAIRDIPVCNVPAYGTDSVAQMVFAHILNLTQHVAYHNETVEKNRWINSKDWCYWDKSLVELANTTLGIIGFGRIGQKVAEIGKALGMQIIVSGREALKKLPAGYKNVSLKNIFTKSDFISLHCPLTEETRHIINRENLAMMKKSAVLINTSRGQLIDEEALAVALNNGVIAAAGLDVLSAEPPKEFNPLLKAKNCIITPHIAWATKAARERLLNVVVKNTAAFIDGNPQNVVNIKR